MDSTKIFLNTAMFLIKREEATKREIVKYQDVLARLLEAIESMPESDPNANKLLGIYHDMTPLFQDLEV